MNSLHDSIRTLLRPGIQKQLEPNNHTVTLTNNEESRSISHRYQ